MVSEKVADAKLLGIFENSFYLTNYENFLKKEPDAEDDDKDKDEDHDARKMRVRRNIPSYGIKTKDLSIMHSKENRF